MTTTNKKIAMYTTSCPHRKKTVSTYMLNLMLSVLTIYFCLPHQTASAAVYKCKVGNKTEYQGRPCANTDKNAIQSNVKLQKVKKSNKEKFSFDFPDTSLKTFFQVVADASGHKLVFGENITGNGSFFYQKTPWDIVLNSAAAKHNLKVKIENKTIYISKPY